MSRRIVEVSKEFHWDLQQEYLKQIGQFVLTDCKDNLLQDGNTGQHVMFADQFRVFCRADLRLIGVIKKYDDVQWVKRAAIADHASPLLFRVFQTDVRGEDGKLSYQLEVLTGGDARLLINNEKIEYWVDFTKRNWWKIAIGTIVVLWSIIP